MKKNIIKYSLIITMLLLVVLGSMHYQNRVVNKMQLEFPVVTTSEDIMGVITSIEHIDGFGFRNDPHQAFIIVDGFIKKDLHVSFEKQTNLVLDDILNTGDSILKDENSTTIVIRNKINQREKYYFELNYK